METSCQRERDESEADVRHKPETDPDRTQILWASSGSSADAMKARTKFSPPVVADGKVYLMTDTATLSIYGLK